MFLTLQKLLSSARARLIHCYVVFGIEPRAPQEARAGELHRQYQAVPLARGASSPASTTVSWLSWFGLFTMSQIHRERERENEREPERERERDGERERSPNPSELLVIQDALDS